MSLNFLNQNFPSPFQKIFIQKQCQKRNSWCRRKFEKKSEKIYLNNHRKNTLEKRILKNGQKSLKNYFREVPSNRMAFFLSILGISETFYLTMAKVVNSTLVCNIGTCSIVLDSPFSVFFGIPFTFFGFLLYMKIFVFILTKNTNRFYTNRDFLTDYFLFFFSLFEIYFFFVLQIILKEKCEWCFLSILFCIGILINFSLLQKNPKNDYNRLILIVLFFFTMFQYLANIVEISLVVTKLN